MSEIRITTDLEGLTPAALEGGFFEGWAAPLTPTEHEEVLRRSAHAVVAWQGQSVVGFVTAISDGVLCAYIPLLEVLGAYRGAGIGTRLVEHLLEEVRHLYMVDVMCDEGVFPFYERVGFTRAGGGVIRDYGARG